MKKPISQFFADLGFPLTNRGWSWGARSGNTVLIRQWDDDPGLPRSVFAQEKDASEIRPRKAGRTERIEHLEFLWSGKGMGYVVMQTGKDAKPGQGVIEDYTDDVVFPIKRLEEQTDGSIRAILGRAVPVEQLAAHAKAHKTIGGKGPLPGSPAAVDLKMRALQFAKVPVRPAQRKFRQVVYEAYEGKCAVSGCTVPEALEAAHKTGRKWNVHNAASDGILLRRDLHALYDQKLLRFDKEGRVRLQPEALEYYRALEGKVTSVRR